MFCLVAEPINFFSSSDWQKQPNQLLNNILFSEINCPPLSISCKETSLSTLFQTSRTMSDNSGSLPRGPYSYKLISKGSINSYLRYLVRYEAFSINSSNICVAFSGPFLFNILPAITSLNSQIYITCPTKFLFFLNMVYQSPRIINIENDVYLVTTTFPNSHLKI